MWIEFWLEIKIQHVFLQFQFISLHFHYVTQTCVDIAAIVCLHWDSCTLTITAFTLVSNPIQHLHFYSSRGHQTKHIRQFTYNFKYTFLDSSNSVTFANSIIFFYAKSSFILEHLLHASSSIKFFFSEQMWHVRIQINTRVLADRPAEQWKHLHILPAPHVPVRRPTSIDFYRCNTHSCSAKHI
jgi:hypothetical protein